MQSEIKPYALTEEDMTALIHRKVHESEPSLYYMREPSLAPFGPAVVCLWALDFS